MKTDPKYKTVIGMEVHLELKTKSKMFCGCSAYHFQIKPNTHTCPVCLGLPGALPVPNKKAIDWCILIGLALKCQPAFESKFDRKNYFYPDLSKGYQISQYDLPFCQKGFLEVENKKIRINRVHMEEDTGKLIHKKIDGRAVSLVDFNRSGVPLVEIVTEADIYSSKEAIEYLKKIQQIVRSLEVSDCDMEKGSMRCEANISLTNNNKMANYKVELKNINSFKFLKKGIEYEIKRQKEILISKKNPIQETRGFNEKTGKTFSQRSKEEAHDYRYFPEPDIPPIDISKNQLEQIKKELKELPDEKFIRFTVELGLKERDVQVVLKNNKTTQYIESLSQLASKDELKELLKIVVNKRVDIRKVSPKKLVENFRNKKTAKLIGKDLLLKIIIKVIKDNEKAVKDYKKGKLEVIGYLIGKVIAESKGKSDPQLVKKMMVEKLKNGI
ncbi:Asp-tRNA(Asn)/Glu-tRNA(Gln) amidotransferase GatCAB subunit B [Candidatus Beckwithbacteria bacterium CG10_big_fil_rev_8_21_14_0_10_34_10]|uniref:Aspartyl/glutamyl-tRNA(Asn/Gln) amidotransferase subunit B n=1 Tax=Candidatus Beckwithbacteria bacterium CG10_big_fil_rev_8_21_14_0_10_34_10 TaxID=1974495 RepID=A0A2H0WAA7_9BACT|nr:MAG: Asp-tRNA(Asn)/Glu-tRNA(Gln) amidotransferase GatCAB subunit B [Candidatus Beckwithbacteria bacterium CG10_big_fil_rev_8_21_14_0_10_34_10]